MSLFVGNISKNVKKNDLADEFEKIGKCEINFKVQPLLRHLYTNASSLLPKMLLRST